MFDDFIEDSDDWLSELYPAQPEAPREVRMPAEDGPPKANRRSPGPACNQKPGRRTAAAR